MRIGNTGSAGNLGSTAATGSSAGIGETGAAAIEVSGGAAALQSSVLQPAQAALSAMPEVDLARVAEIRDALESGEISFDAGKLAALIARHHGGGA